MKIIHIPDCPACGGSASVSALTCSAEAKQRFVRLRRTKYGGLMDNWLSDLELDVQECGACAHV